jgi:hypothetical protein
MGPSKVHVFGIGEADLDAVLDAGLKIPAPSLERDVRPQSSPSSLFPLIGSWVGRARSRRFLSPGRYPSLRPCSDDRAIGNQTRLILRLPSLWRRQSMKQPSSRPAIENQGWPDPTDPCGPGGVKPARAPQSGLQMAAAGHLFASAQALNQAPRRNFLLELKKRGEAE